MKKKKKSFPKKPALVLTAAALLLVGSTVGSTRAALTYYSENYSAQMNMQSIGVSLLENDKVVSSRDYVSNNEWKGTSDGTLLTNLLGKDETFTPGKKYNEAISVKNSGTIDTFVRVIITKSWQDKEGKKHTEPFTGSDRAELPHRQRMAGCRCTIHERAYRSLLYQSSQSG